MPHVGTVYAEDKYAGLGGFADNLVKGLMEQYEKEKAGKELVELQTYQKNQEQLANAENLRNAIAGMQNPSQYQGPTPNFPAFQAPPSPSTAPGINQLGQMMLKQTPTPTTPYQQYQMNKPPSVTQLRAKRIMELKNKQFIMTIPKAIAQAMGLSKGDSVEWLFDRGDVVLRKY